MLDLRFTGETVPLKLAARLIERTYMISETPIHAETQGAAEAAANAWETTKEKAGEALHSGERYVRENPGVSTLGLLGAGFVVGVLVGWSVAHQPEPDYSGRVGKFVKNWSRKCSLD